MCSITFATQAPIATQGSAGERERIASLSVNRSVPPALEAALTELKHSRLKISGTIYSRLLDTHSGSPTCDAYVYGLCMGCEAGRAQGASVRQCRVINAIWLMKVLQRRATSKVNDLERCRGHHLALYRLNPYQKMT